jgi:serine/threonine protein kinase
MTEPACCPDSSRWPAFLEGGLPGTEAAGLNIHLETCAACQALLDGLVAGGGPWAELAAPAEAPPALERLAFEAAEAGAAADGLPEGFFAPPRQPGQLGTLGRYDVIEEIGRGCMGVVFKGFDPELHRPVAIKVLAPQLATSAAARQRFAREARAVAAVKNEHVVAIFDVPAEARLPYFVMEYVAGMSLQEKLDAEGPFGVKEVLRIGMQVAAGLAAAHAQGLVHRDVKPANVLLENGVERVKITDFGLARAVDDASLTQSGFIAGTPEYMAPEQADGARVDQRADLFGLGGVLYALCTGHPPFRAETARAVLKRICEERPRPIRESNPEVPQWLDDLITGTLLARPPAQRSTAEAISAALAEGLQRVQAPQEAPQPAPAEQPPQGGWPWWRLTRAMVYLLLFGAVVYFYGPSALSGFSHLRSEWACQRGADHLKAGRFDEAEASFNEAIRLSPENARAYTKRGLLWLEKLESQKAIDDLTEAIRLNPESAWAFNLRAQAWQLRPQFEKAIRDCDEAVRLAPQEAAHYETRARARLGAKMTIFWVASSPGTLVRLEGKTPERVVLALADYTQAIQLAGADAPGSYFKGRGHVWYLKGEIDEAISDYEEAIRRSPEEDALKIACARAYRYRGSGRMANKELDRAIGDFGAAIRLNPDAKTYRQRGNAWKAKGDQARADADFKEADRLEAK